MQESISSILTKNKISFKDNGTTQYILDCPVCGAKDHVYMGKDNGVWDCKKCMQGDKPKPWWSYVKLIKDELDDQPTSSVKPVYISGLEKDEKAKDFLFNERKILPEIAKQLYFGTDGQGNITMPYFRKDQLYHYKVKNSSWKKGEDNKYWYLDELGNQKSGAVNQYLYNIDSVTKNSDEIVITEGEFDCAAFYSYDYKGIPCVAMPGAGYSLKSWEIDKLKNLKKIYINLDPDSAGTIAAYRLACTLGIERCYKVSLPEDIHDLNYALMIGAPKGLISNSFSSAKLFDIPGTEEAKDIIIGSIKLPSPVPTGIHSWDDVLQGGLRFGLTLISSEGGMGKSAFALFLGMKLMEKENRVVYLPYEGGRDKLLKRFEHLSNGSIDKLKQNLVVVDPNKSPTFKKTEDYLSYLTSHVKRYGIKIFIVDDLEKMFGRFPNVEGNIYQFQDHTINELAEWCDANQVILIALHHNTKEAANMVQGWKKEAKVPTFHTRDLKGGGGIGDRASNVIFMWRNKDMNPGIDHNQHLCFFHFTKNRDGGNLWSVKAQFNPVTKIFEELI